MKHKIHLLWLTLVFSGLAGFSQPPSTSPDQSASTQDHVAKAQQYMRAHRPDLAIPELDALVKLNPSDMESQANLGVLLYFGHQYAQAVPHLRTAIQATPDLYKIQALLGLSEKHLNDDQNARADLATALPHLKGEKIQREVGDTLVESYMATNEIDNAASTVAVLLDADPTDPGLLLSSYRFYSELANNAMITLALAAPDSAELHQAMAQALARHGDDDAAVANYRQAIKLNPKLPGLHYELGSLLYNSVDEKLQVQASAEFEAALAINSHDEKAQLMLGEDAARHGDMKKAFDAESRAVELQPNDPDACTELAKTLIAMRQPDKARPLLEHALSIDSMNETAHYRLSTLDRQQGKTEEAKQELAQYQKYKEMKARLRAIFRDMRMKLDDKPEDEGGMQK
ncbi:MAG TPA: tetratricopeptide repeat protein [Terracidiphilus sp.]|jgi:Tfp pilus assembly protein PilF